MKACLLLALLAAPALASTSFHGGHDGHGDAHEVIDAASELVRVIEAQPPMLAQDVFLEFSAARRRTIDYLPLLVREDQRGSRLGLMTLHQRRAAHGLLRTVMSEEGYLRVQGIRSLEDVLRATSVGTGLMRVSDAYTVQFFGRPGGEDPWAFKFEGHHLSVNATVVGESFRGTPLFFGANPAEVRTGPDAGLRVLGTQEDLARALLATLDEGQRKSAVQAEFVPEEVIPVGSLREPTQAQGLSLAQMNDEQQALLLRTVASYARNLRPAFAGEELRRLEAAGLESLHFLWRGGTGPGEPFSYLIHGPTVSIQFDLIEDRPGAGANHVHCIWRDPERDFGDDLLLRHYSEDHGSEEGDE